jgi:hypothetical protein
MGTKRLLSTFAFRYCIENFGRTYNAIYINGMCCSVGGTNVGEPSERKKKMSFKKVDRVSVVVLLVLIVFLVSAAGWYPLFHLLFSF